MTSLRVLLFGLAVLFPVITLIPLGSLWLWQSGWLLYWVVASLCFSGLFYALAMHLLPPHRINRDNSGDRYASFAFEQHEKVAWDAVVTLGDSIDPNVIQSRNDILALAVQTIELVAHELQPNEKHPVWNFTVPEILLLIERVSARIRPVIIETLPFGEQLTVGQALRLYEWRGAVGVAERAYDVWRLLRLLNPIAAVTQEARERITKQIVVSVRDDLTKRVMRMFTLEVGFAAIDLYSGRLRGNVTPKASSAEPGEPTSGQTPTRSIGRLRQYWNEARKVTKTAQSLYTKKTPPNLREKLK